MTWILAIAAVGCAYMAWRWTLATAVFVEKVLDNSQPSQGANACRGHGRMYFWLSVAAFAAALALAFASGFTTAGGFQ